MIVDLTGTITFTTENVTNTILSVFNVINVIFLFSKLHYLVLKGPCAAGQYFSFDSVKNETSCSCFTAFAPDLQRDICVEKLTRDTCKLGQLVTADQETGNFKCDCQKEEMKTHYWPQDGKCYQHFTQGPCESSLLFRLDEKTGRPACLPPINGSSSSSIISITSPSGRQLRKRAHQHPFVRLFSPQF